PQEAVVESPFELSLDHDDLPPVKAVEPPVVEIVVAEPEVAFEPALSLEEDAPVEEMVGLTVEPPQEAVAETPDEPMVETPEVVASAHDDHHPTVAVEEPVAPRIDAGPKASLDLALLVAEDDAPVEEIVVRSGAHHLTLLATQERMAAALERAVEARQGDERVAAALEGVAQAQRQFAEALQRNTETLAGLMSLLVENRARGAAPLPGPVEDKRQPAPPGEAPRTRRKEDIREFYKFGEDKVAQLEINGQGDVVVLNKG
ncbi:MAG: hypothetical protein HQK87_08445, partial [Nitrospinae bacterium]|nr:hypothetical protein [Nitrospinota bacterium]